VGPEDSAGLSSHVLTAREEPAFGGPAAGIAAGLTAIREASPIPADATVVIACDMPHVGRAVPSLIAAFLRARHVDGVIALDDEGRRQPLAACYRTDALASAIARADRAGGLDSLSVSRLLESLALEELPVPGRWTADVDTWEDAERLGIHRAMMKRDISEER
jgi:molybdopterin-guanine dinucleotide biosynthesis protein A